jgi:hypothetical protein
MKRYNLVKTNYLGIACLIFATFLTIFSKHIYAEGTDRQLTFPSGRVNLNCYVRLGSGWDNFIDLHPEGASFGIPLSLSTDYGTAEGGVSWPRNFYSVKVEG